MPSVLFLHIPQDSVPGKRQVPQFSHLQSWCPFHPPAPELSRKATAGQEAEEVGCDATHHSMLDSTSNSRSPPITQLEGRRCYQSLTATYRNWNMMRGADTNVLCREVVFPAGALSWRWHSYFKMFYDFKAS